MTKYKYGNPEAPIVLIQPVGDHDLPEIEGEVAQIRKLTALDFQMIAVKVDDWNLDLSPWKAPAVFGNEDFGEGAASLLEEILHFFILKLYLLTAVNTSINDKVMPSSPFSTKSLC